MYRRNYCLKWRFSLILNSLRVSTCANDSWQGVVGPSTVYSEATLVLSSFCEGRAQQITAPGVIAMEKVRVPKLYK